MVKCADTKDYGKVVPGVPFSERSMFIQLLDENVHHNWFRPTYDLSYLERRNSLVI